MIVDAIFLALATIVGLLGTTLGAITKSVGSVMPDEITTAVNYFVSKIMLWQFLFPIDQLFLAIAWVITFFGFLFLTKIILWVWAILPWTGDTKAPLPKITK